VDVEIRAAAGHLAERLDRFVGNLLDMTRLESGAMQPKCEWTPLEEIIGSALERIESLWQAPHAHEILTDIDDDLLVFVDPILIEQLLVNLLENSVKYASAATHLHITARVDAPNHFVVDVIDAGPGIPLGTETHIFERFARGQHTGVAGVGLGLAIAQSIAQVHGGSLVALPHPKGAHFRLRVPLPPLPRELQTGLQTGLQTVEHEAGLSS